MKVEADEIRRAMDAVGEIAAQVVLPLGRRRWRGPSGSHAGRGVGSSVNFMEHRPYVSGDDLRHIDWRATARTGLPTLKVFEEEVNPSLDLFFDASESMSLDEEKRQRSLECLYLLLATARREGVACRIFSGTPDGRGIFELERGRMESGWEAGGLGAPPLSLVPWRSSGMRVLISDLLYPSDPAALLREATSLSAAFLILAPFSSAEALPAWDELDLIEDCESGERFEISTARVTRLDYERAYREHFDAWTRAAISTGSAMLRINCSISLGKTVLSQGSPLASLRD